MLGIFKLPQQCNANVRDELPEIMKFRNSNFQLGVSLVVELLLAKLTTTVMAESLQPEMIPAAVAAR